MSEKVVVYSAKGCKECEMVKDFLTHEGIEFEVRDILANQVYQQEVESFGFMGIPVTAYANKAVKGFNIGELNEIIELVK